MLNKNEKTKLFSALANEMKTTSISDATNFYRAFIRLITRTVKNSGKLELPDFGTFYIKEWKGRTRTLNPGMGGVIGNNQIKVGAKSHINFKFKPCTRLKEYIDEACL